MRGRLLTIPAVARALGFILIAIAIIAAAIHFPRDPHQASAPSALPAGGADPLAAELARCQALSIAGKDDAGCEAAWAESRKRFFSDTRPSTPIPTTSNR